MSAKLARKALETLRKTKVADEPSRNVQAPIPNGATEKTKRTRRSDVAADGLPVTRVGLKKAKLLKKKAGSGTVMKKRLEVNCTSTAIEKLRKEQTSSRGQYEKNLAYFTSSARIGTHSEAKQKILEALQPSKRTANGEELGKAKNSKAKRKGFGDGYFSDSD